MKPNRGRHEEPGVEAINDYLSSPEPDAEEFKARNRFDEDDDQPGIPSGYVERSSETRRSPVPRRESGRL